jgi:hypothetical protein
MMSSPGPDETSRRSVLKSIIALAAMLTVRAAPIIERVILSSEEVTAAGKELLPTITRKLEPALVRLLAGRHIMSLK